MLNNLTFKLMPLVYLALATTGCGKKIAEASNQTSFQIENQELPATYIVRLDGSIESRKNYLMPLPAQFEIPDRLRIKRGSTLNKVVEISYDVNEFDNDDFQFKCSYVASVNLNEMILKNCVDYDGDDFGDISAQQFSLRSKDIIQLRFTGASSTDLVVEAIYSMNWI